MEFAQTEKIEQMAQQIIERAQHLRQQKMRQQKMQQQAQDRPVIVAIDGRCASGKTTLGSFIEQKTGYTVLHLDHFFLQPHQRTPQRLAQPGGNVDYERFRQQVMVPLQQGVSFSYRPYDCLSAAFVDAVEVLPTPIVFVEGSYSCHPALWEGYDLHIFLTVQPTEQLRRIAIRNGQQGLKVFQERWIPLEERYFSAFSVQQRCELCFATD